MNAEERAERISPEAAWDCALGLMFGMPVGVGLFAVGVWIEQHSAGHPLPPVCRILLGLLPLHLGLTGTAALVLARRRPTQRQLVRLCLGEGGAASRGRAWRAALRSLAWVYPVTLLLSLVATGALLLMGKKPTGQAVVELLFSEPNPLWFGVAVGAIVILVPLAEEILFRFLLHDALTLVGAGVATPLTAMTFALIHGVPEQIPSLFFLGLVLQELRARTGELRTSILLHAGFNACGLIFLTVARLVGMA